MFVCKQASFSQVFLNSELVLKLGHESEFEHARVRNKTYGHPSGIVTGRYLVDGGMVIQEGIGRYFDGEKQL